MTHQLGQPKTGDIFLPVYDTREEAVAAAIRLVDAGEESCDF